MTHEIESCPEGHAYCVDCSRLTCERCMEAACPHCRRCPDCGDSRRVDGEPGYVPVLGNGPDGPLCEGAAP